VAAKGTPKPAERFDGERFEDELLNPYESVEGRLERWLEQREAITEIHERYR